MNNGDLDNLRNLINNLLSFAKEKTNALDRDSAPLWYYLKERNNQDFNLDAILLNDIFLYLSFLSLSDDEIIDGELEFINHVLDFNFNREEFLNYLNANLNEKDFINSLPVSFSLFYEFDKYLVNKGKDSRVEIVESLFDLYEKLGSELIGIDGVLEDERIAYENFIHYLRKNLDDLKEFNYDLMVKSLNINPKDDIISSKDLDDQFYEDINFLRENFGTDSYIGYDVLDNVNDLLFKNQDSLESDNNDNPLLESFNRYMDNSLEKYKNKSSNESLKTDDSISNNGSQLDSNKSDNKEGEQTLNEEVGEETLKESEKEEDESLEDILAKLNKLVGLETVKEDVNSLINLIQIRKIRSERGIKQPDMSLHLVFSGNPGTGKTTVARLLGGIYSKLGILSKGHLIETDRSGLVAGYVGQTAIKTQDMIKEAMGGILFIDEAYALSSSKGENDFGHEAIDTILKAMEDNRDDFIVIVAGYPDLMDEFLHSNPGLESRFNKHLFFEDYNPKELFEIFVSMAEESSLKLDEKSEKFLKGHFEDVYNCRGDNFSNGRYVRNLFEKVLSNQANRLVGIEELSDEDLNTLTIEDFDDCV